MEDTVEYKSKQEATWRRLEQKLERLKPHLLKAGRVNRKRERGGRTVWVLRYPVTAPRTRLGSVYLGGEDMAKRTRSLLARWREEAVSPEERRRREQHELLQIAGRAKGYSRRALKRLKLAAIEASSDRVGMLAFTLGLRFDDRAIRFGKRTGRPSKSGLTPARQACRGAPGSSAAPGV